MGKVQVLRRTVRIELVAYAERHPDDFEAHMAASASIWLLAGRQGLTPPQQLALLHQAEETVARLSVGKSSSALIKIQQQLRELVGIVARRVRAQHAESDFLRLFSPDFAKWTEELAAADGEG